MNRCVKTVGKIPNDICVHLTDTAIKPKQLLKHARKLAFSKFVQTHECCAGEAVRVSEWKCCSRHFTRRKEFHQHVAKEHQQEIIDATSDILVNGCPDAKWLALQPAPSLDQHQGNEEQSLPCLFESTDVYPWLPAPPRETGDVEEEILLFYKYRNLPLIEHVCSWQKELCQRLCLTGKIRVAVEGINITLGGKKQNTALYIAAVCSHPLFSDMTEWDFKHSTGRAADFPDGLKVGIYQEIVPMGRDPQQISYENAGEHVTADEFHDAISKHLGQANSDNSAVFIDCRNFYESKIGQFEGAVCPDLRKFSYWPDYVDQNECLFEQKKVYMYCTGGIRCERGSAYLRAKGICDKVYQLHGGIHKYIEKYPDGYFRGKLFVFDDRYHITANDDILSECCYCGEAWDKYQPCSSIHCHQLVLSCTGCRAQGLTACCSTCQSHNANLSPSGANQQETPRKREECDCTRRRVRIPVENNSNM